MGRSYPLIKGKFSEGFRNSGETSWWFMRSLLASLNFTLPKTQLAPNAREMPAILVVANETAQMQPDTIEASEMNAASGDIRQREDFLMVCHAARKAKMKLHTV